MCDEIQLISDGNGMAVIGEPEMVEKFLAAEGLQSKGLDARQLRRAIGYVAGTAQAGSEIGANFGRWVKLTEESARAAQKYGLMTSSKSGLSMGVIQAKGQAHGIKGIVQFASRPGSVLTNPAMLAGAAGVMAQFAMQQTMDEIVAYLATIDAKIDDVLRAQQDAVVADMVGVDLVIEEAMVVRGHTGTVSDVTWSKVQATAQTIARTQAYALRQLDGHAENLENEANVQDLLKAAKRAQAKVPDWLAVLAHCFRLQDALAVLELDHVLERSPDALELHRQGLMAAREERLQMISRSTMELIRQMGEAATTANRKILTNPHSAKSVVNLSNQVSNRVDEFLERLSIAGVKSTTSPRRWLDAAEEARDQVVEIGAGGIDAVRRLSSRTRDRVIGAFRPSGQREASVESPELDAAQKTDAGDENPSRRVAGVVGSVLRRKKSSAADPSEEPNPTGPSSDE